MITRLGLRGAYYALEGAEKGMEMARVAGRSPVLEKKESAVQKGFMDPKPRDYALVMMSLSWRT